MKKAINISRRAYGVETRAYRRCFDMVMFICRLNDVVLNVARFLEYVFYYLYHEFAEMA